MSAPVSLSPRYRYRDEAPETLSLPVAELLSYLPADCRRGLPEEGRRVELPCRELLAGNTPRVGLGLLSTLLPDLVVLPGEAAPETRIKLPAGWLAVHFRFVSKRVELSPEETGSAPPASADVFNESTKTTPEKDAPTPAIPEVVKPGDLAEGIAASGTAVHPEAKTITAETVEVEPQAITTPASSPTPDTESPRSGFFESLPTFRRRDAEAPVQHPGSASNQAPVAEVAAPDGPEEGAPVSEGSSGNVLTLERLWKLDAQDQLADPGPLQALFMTDEKLTLESVLSLAGQLPGLSACVLAHGDQVVCTSKAASGIDLQTLSGHAMTMLSQIRESSSKMGLGAVPAVTLHAEQGVVSFLHNGELCLLVLHADRGFIPGVRERLQEMLGHLTEARPALPERSTAAEDGVAPAAGR